MEHYGVEITARLAADWPEITQQKDPLPEAGEFKDAQAKRDMLDESDGDNLVVGIGSLEAWRA